MIDHHYAHWNCHLTLLGIPTFFPNLGHKKLWSRHLVNSSLAACWRWHDQASMWNSFDSDKNGGTHCFLSFRKCVFMRFVGQWCVGMDRLKSLQISTDITDNAFLVYNCGNMGSCLWSIRLGIHYPTHLWLAQKSFSKLALWILIIFHRATCGSHIPLASQWPSRTPCHFAGPGLPVCKQSSTSCWLRSHWPVEESLQLRSCFILFICL